MVFFIAIIWIVLAFILALVAKSKGCSFGIYFVIGLFLSPIIEFIILLIMSKNKKALLNSNLANKITKKCLVCGEMVENNAKVCPYCRRSIFEGDVEEEDENDDDFEDDDEEDDENIKNAFDEIFSAAGRTDDYDENDSSAYDEEEKDDKDYSRHDKKRNFENEKPKHSEREERNVSNDNKGAVGVKYYYCKHCGVKNSSVTGLINSSGCLKSPTKKHELYEGAEKNQYICKYCGVKNTSITGLVNSSYCPKNPTKKHEPAL